MKALLRAAALVLALLMLIPFTGCACVRKALHDALITPAPEVTAEPTPKTTADFGIPEPAPSDTPDPLKYSFDRETLQFEDGYVRFTLPDGLNLMQNVNRYEDQFSVFFVRPGSAFPSVRYVVEASPYEGILDLFTEDLLIMSCEQYVMTNYNREVEIEPVRFSKVDSDGSVSEIIFEYTFTLYGDPMHGLNWLADTGDGHAASVIYIWAEGSDFTPTLSSIKQK